jgi:hypothetical protein
MNLLSKPTVGPVVLRIKEKFMFFGDSDNMSIKDAVTGQVTARLQRPAAQCAVAANRCLAGATL